MTPRPLHRWKSFWFGIVVLVFLGWSWGTSKWAIDSLTLETPMGSSTASHWAGYLCFSHEYGPGHSGFGFDASHTDITFDPRWFVQPFLRGDGVFRIAHWFLILLLLFPWICLLTWRRAAALPPQAPRPFHRWKIFWVGLLMLGFLGMSWFRSLNSREGFQGSIGDRVVQCDHSHSEVSLHVREGSPAFHPEFHLVHERAWGDANWFPQPFSFSSFDSKGSGSYLLYYRVAHYLLILLLCFVWIPPMIWRFRRTKRSAASP
jgi:hypothetical protein